MTITVIGIVIAVMVMMALYHRSIIRTFGQLLLGLTFGTSTVATLALAYGSFALEQKGGGVLILFAIPAGIVAWITGYLFFAALKHERYYDLSVDEKIRYNVESLDASVTALHESIAKKTAERNRFWTGAKRRAELDRDIAREQWMLQKLPQLRTPLQQRETYKDDEP